MEFMFGERENALREEIRDYLKDHVPEGWAGLFSRKPEAWDQSVEFCKDFAKNGWLIMSWPKEYGGKEASHWEQTVVREELMAAQEPRGPQYMNLNYIGPAIMLFGTEEQKRTYLPPMTRGEVTWCQGFSEPNAGSDLASLQTRATADGDSYVINGQKIWTSYSMRADYCFLLARTDPDAPKHKGISVFLVDMKTPGITVRPIDGLHGNHHFQEVFWDNVRVHRNAMLGRKNEGWSVILAALAFERSGFPTHAPHEKLLGTLAAYAKERTRNGRPLSEDPVIRQRFAALEAQIHVNRLINYRVVSVVEKGQVPGLEGSLARLRACIVIREITKFGMELLGPEAELMLEEKWAPLRGMMEFHYGTALASGVAAGTMEVQRNIIAERGLGLPRSR